MVKGTSGKIIVKDAITEEEMKKEIKRHEDKEDNLVAILVSVSVFFVLLMIGTSIYCFKLRREKGANKYDKP